MVERISDNVGKKIVEALRMQNMPQEGKDLINTSKQETAVETQDSVTESVQDIPADQQYSIPTQASIDEQIDFENKTFINNTSNQVSLDAILQNSINQNLGNINLADIQSDFELPNNVAILSHLISKLPSGVTKQTGAIIIKQTMEALGIPMKSVIREAQQVQETLASRTRECQKGIVDYRKQIATLEIKVQQYQKQTVAMNDMINLFINTGV